MGHVTPLADTIGRQGRKVIWIAAQLGVDPSTITRWSSGERAMPAARVAQLAKLLNVPEHEISGQVTA